MRLKLYISGLEVDTYPDQALNLTREIYTKDNVASTDIAYSQQISIPATDRNMKLFDYVHLVDYWEKPSPHLPYEGIASIEDGSDLRVIIEIRGFTFERGVIKTYQIAFYIFATELFTKFGNDNLADVDFSALDFVMNRENVVASWDVGGTDYFCPIMAHSKPFYYIEETLSSPIAGNIYGPTTGVELSDCKPAYSLKKLVEIIFSSFGVSVTWDAKISNHLDEAFILPSKAAGGIEYTVEFAETYFFGQERGDYAFNGVNQLITLSQIINDPGHRWTPDKYTAPESGYYNFAVGFNQKIISPIYVKYRINGGSFVSQGPYFEKIGTANFAIPMNAGDYVEFYYLGVVGVWHEGTTIEMKSFSGSAYNANIQAAFQMPDMKVSEFIKGFLMAFKLTLLQTGANTYKIFDTRSMYSDTDAVIRDWSAYVDQKVMAYQKRDSFKRLVLSHAEGEDEYNKIFKSLRDGLAYGAVKYDTELVLGQNEITQQSIFTVFPPVFLGRQTAAGELVEPATSLLLHQNIDGEGAPVLAKFLLFYRNGSDGCDLYYLQNGIDSSGPTFSSIETFGYYSQTKDLVSKEDSPALHYGFENPAYGVPSQDILVYEFWRDVLEIFINNAAFQLNNIPFRVPAWEMAAFKINDTILINGIYHIPTKAIYDYTNDLIKLDMIVYHPTYAATLPQIAGNGEVVNPLDVNQGVMHTSGGRRVGDRIFKTIPKNIWRPKKVS